jgi:hypothetical protein
MGQLRIKFMKEFPTDEKIKEMADTWDCFKITELVIKKSISKNILLIDIWDLKYEISLVFSQLYSEYPDAWISGECIDDNDIFKSYHAEYDGKNKVDYTRYIGWQESSFEKERKISWNIMKSVGFGNDYVKFSFRDLKEEDFDTVIDYRMTDEYFAEVMAGSKFNKPLPVSGKVIQ